MKLADWLYRHRLQPAALRKLLKVRSRATVTRYLTGERLPNPEMMRTIARITQGAVQSGDFLDPSPAQCEETVTLKDGRTKSVFPWTPEWEQWLVEREAVLIRDDRGVPAVIEKAMGTLGTRVCLGHEPGLYLIDGNLRDARGLIRAANRVLAHQGKPLLDYPGVTHE